MICLAPLCCKAFLINIKVLTVISFCTAPESTWQLCTQQSDQFQAVKEICKITQMTDILRNHVSRSATSFSLTFLMPT